MTNPQCINELEAVEERFKHKYGDVELKMLYRQFKSLSVPMWKKLCELMIRKGGGYLPSVEEWSKMHGAHQRDFDITQKVYVSCEACKGTGIRMFLHRREDGQHGTPPVRCDCGNGENYPKFPTIAEAEQTRGFVRWLPPSGSLFEAISAANGDASPSKEPEKSQEAPEEPQETVAVFLPGDKGDYVFEDSVEVGAKQDAPEEQEEPEVDFDGYDKGKTDMQEIPF